MELSKLTVAILLATSVSLYAQAPKTSNGVSLAVESAAPTLPHKAHAIQSENLYIKPSANVAIPMRWSGKLPTKEVRELEFAMEHSDKGPLQTSGWKVREVKSVIIEVPVETYGLGLDGGETKSRVEYIKSHQTLCGKEKTERLALLSRAQNTHNSNQSAYSHSINRFEETEVWQWPQTYAIKEEGKDCTTLITKGVVEFGFWVMVSDSNKNGVRIRYKVKNLLSIDTVKSGEAYVQLPRVEAYEGETFVSLDGVLAAPINIAQEEGSVGNKIKISVRQLNKPSK